MTHIDWPHSHDWLDREKLKADLEKAGFKVNGWSNGKPDCSPAPDEETLQSLALGLSVKPIKQKKEEPQESKEQKKPKRRRKTKKKKEA